MLKKCALILTAILTAGITAAATGDAYVYRVSNGYNNEIRGNVSYRIDKSEVDRIEVAVTTDMPGASGARTEIYTKSGNWLRHPLVNHDQVRDYEFPETLPVAAPPRDADKSWSTRTVAIDPATGQRRSVRVDGEVLGSERITVPAGTFDTVKIMRRVYAGDWDGFMRETQIVETEWYSAALGLPVKSESTSSWQDMSRCARGGCPLFRGDWNVFELTEINPASL